MDNTKKSCVNIFVKYPERGKVKTRLASAINAEHASEIYKCFVLDTLGKIKGMGIETIINYMPSGCKREFEKWLGGEYQFEAQHGHELGERMKNAFLSSFERGFKKVLLVGTDVPDAPEEYISEGLKRLGDYGAVIGPSEDGGYYLIGFSKEGFRASVFEGMSWSRPEVFAETIERLAKAGVKHYVLPVWSDVDTVEDLKELMERNKCRTGMCPQTYAYLTEKLKF